MLQLAAATAAEMPARRRLPFGARLQHLQHLGAIANNAGADFLPRQRERRIDEPRPALGGGVAARANGRNLQDSLLRRRRRTAPGLSWPAPRHAVDSLHAPFR